jgi:glycosyltransferase involved in cell wall biosynthesis
MSRVDHTLEKDRRAVIPVADEMAPNTLTIILPALNEADAIGLQIQALLAHPAWRALPLAEIVVVDNGSDDATAAVAQAAGAHVISEPRRGYGAACYAGLRAARSDVLLLMDADGSDDLAGAARVARLVLSGEADLAVGSRVRGCCEAGALTLQQRVGNTVAALLLRLLCGVCVTDLGPTRAIRREALLTLDPHERTYGWSTETLVKAARAGYRIVEEPVDYHRRAGGVSKVSGTFRGSLRAGYCILTTVLRYARWRPAATPPIHRGQQPTMAGEKVVHS